MQYSGVKCLMLVMFFSLCGFAGCADEDLAASQDSADFGVPCLVDSDCSSGYSCVVVDTGYICTQGCVSDSDCPSGGACVSTVIGSYCSTDALPDDGNNGFTDDSSPDMSPAATPDPTPAPTPDPTPAPTPDPDPGCTSDADCPQGQFCDAGQCVEPMNPEGCTDDRFEPNETFGQAAATQEGQFNGLSICAGDEDFYRIALVANTNLTVTVVFDSEGGTLGFQLVDGNGQSLQTSLGNNGIVSLTRPIGVAGSYGVRVFGQSPGAENLYDMTVEVSEVDGTCQDDAREPNDSAAQASGIGDGTVTLTACAGSDDWFRFTAQAGGSISATISFTHTQSDLNLFLYQSDGVTILDSSQGATNQESVSASAPVSGEYLLRVSSNSQEGGAAYTMTLSGAGEPMNPNGCSDMFEPNNTSVTAASVGEGVFASLQICESNPDDWYAINLNAGDELTADVFTIDLDATLFLEIVDTNGTSILDGTITLLGLATVSATVDSAGTYFVHAAHFLGPTSTYSMGLSIAGGPEPPQPPDCADDLGEPNDSYLSAVNLVGSFNNAVACQGDDDYYEIEVLEAGTELVVRATFSTEFGDVDLELLESDGFTRVVRSGTQGVNETLTHTVANPGTYFIRAYLRNGDATAYDISVTTGGVAPSCNDIYESNNTTDTATTIIAGSYSSLDVCESDTLDYFAIELGPGATVDVSIDFVHAIADLDLRLLDTNGVSALASSSGVFDGESVSDTVTTGGTYYIEVEHYNGDPNTYTMTIDVQGGGDPLDCNDIFEPNDSAQEAAIIAPTRHEGLGFCGGVDDFDFFSVDVLSAGTLQIDVLFSDLGGDIDLNLLSANGLTTIASSTSSTDNESITESVSAGTYLIEVYGFLGGVTNSYDLEVSILPP
jgi:Cys-rich repeat protein